jgi:hypothetical protein
MRCCSPRSAAGRGEIGPHPVPAHILAAPHALLRYELAIRHHRPTDAELAQIIDDITISAIQHTSTTQALGSREKAEHPASALPEESYWPGPGPLHTAVASQQATEPLQVRKGVT